MFIYLEGKYNSSKGNLIILGTIMVIDAHLKNVNCVNNKINTLSQQLEAKSKPLTHKYITSNFRYTHEKGKF
jgi:hypothetical protein